MEYLFIEYPKCSTCKNAKKWLVENHIHFYSRNIVEDTPTSDELKKWVKVSHLDIKKFFNTSGLVYRELNLKETLDGMTDEEKFQLLSSNGMLIKRPILVGKDFVLVGFRENEWKDHVK